MCEILKIHRSSYYNLLPLTHRDNILTTYTAQIYHTHYITKLLIQTKKPRGRQIVTVNPNAFKVDKYIILKNNHRTFYQTKSIFCLPTRTIPFHLLWANHLISTVGYVSLTSKLKQYDPSLSSKLTQNGGLGVHGKRELETRSSSFFSKLLVFALYLKVKNKS